MMEEVSPNPEQLKGSMFLSLYIVWILLRTSDLHA